MELNAIQKLECKIYGYIREINNDFPNVIAETVLKYFDQFENKYMSILIDKNISAFKNLGNLSKDKITMPESILFIFNESFCPNCKKWGDDNDIILKYMASYKTYESYGQSGWFNSANSYQCIKCKYYIVHNVKRRVFYAGTYSHKKASPFSKDKYKNIPRMSENELKKKYKTSKTCDACKCSTLELDSDFAWGNSGKTRMDQMCYCVNCALFYDYYEYNS
eukprot:482546_1